MSQTKYDPSKIESKWYSAWEKNKVFSPSGKGESYCIMIPPPNVTGTLHMGHAFQVTLMDILCRYKRMCGFNTLWQAGTDHAGIATQMVVERKLTAQGLSRNDLGREKFIDQVWEWKDQSGNIITKQLRRMGASLDWDSERFTLDEGLSRAVRKVFIDLYNKNLIYKGKKLVNWDPVLQTALSDLEVIQNEEDGKIWTINYKIEDENNFLSIATTRPETLLGDTGVAVNPNDERYKKYIGKNIIVPLVGRKVKIIGDDYVDSEFGTGCLKITPAHDFNDFEIAKRHNLEVINIFDSSARVLNTFDNYSNLDRYEARKKILKDLDELKVLIEEKDHKMVIPRGDRSHAVIEPYMTDQWYVKTKEIAEKAMEAVKESEIKFVPKNWEKTYFEWMNNIEDWCISRQLWWGHRIPAWYDAENNIYVGNSEEEIRDKFQIRDEVQLTQDEDVLDTWFSSSLWPFSTLGWPDENDRVKTFYPTSVLITGFDIIFFWVARMIMMGLEFLEDVPFKEVYVHGLVKDAHGNKMSKSKGNIIDPIDLIDGIDIDSLLIKRSSDLMQPEMAEKIRKNTKKEYPNGIEAYGTDALRFTFSSLATSNRDINFDLKKLEGNRNFCNKIWNAARYIKLLKDEYKVTSVKNPEYDDTDVWIYKRLNNLITSLRTNYEKYRFDFASKDLYDFIWNDFCNWYIELSKIDIKSKDSKKIESKIFHLEELFKNIILLLHPTMPFITEELKLFSFNDDRFLIQHNYPTEIEIPDESRSNYINWLTNIISEIRKYRSELGINPSAKVKIKISNLRKEDERLVLKYQDYLKSIARLSECEIIKEINDDNVPTIVVENLKIQIYDDNINISEELKRLSKEIEKTNKLINGLKLRLENKNFVQNAPGHVVVKDQENLDSLKVKLTELENQQKHMNG